MHIHILGICGTFMGGLAALAREAGHKVTGCDAGVYPPMSDQLRALGIDLIEGWGADQLALKPDFAALNKIDVIGIIATGPGRDGVDLVSGKPKIVIELAQAKRQDVAFKAELLKLARVIE